MPSSDLPLQLRKAAAFLDQLEDLIDERERLVSTLHLQPSKADNLDFVGVLSSVKNTLSQIHQDMATGLGKDHGAAYNSSIDTYASLLSRVENDPYVNASEYAFSEKYTPDDDHTSKKSVRFKDYSEDSDADDTAQMRDHLMGTAAAFKPYRDSEEEDRNTLSSVNTSNQELFAQSQQQMLEQDRNLDVLHDSIRTQHSMGVNINQELDEHLIILGDLERGVDGSSTRLRRAATGLADFRRRVRENGSLATIIVLTVILILLLVVLN